MESFIEEAIHRQLSTAAVGKIKNKLEESEVYLRILKL